MIRYDFAFDGAAEFSRSAARKVAKSDLTTEDEDGGQLAYIEEKGDGRVSVYLRDGMAPREAECILADYYNSRAKALIEHVSALGEAKGV